MLKIFMNNFETTSVAVAFAENGEHQMAIDILERAKTSIVKPLTSSLVALFSSIPTVLFIK